MSPCTRSAFASAALLFAFLTACNGGGSTVGPRIPQCEAIPPAFDPQAALVSPAKGATGVPTSIGTIAFVVADPALRQGETVTLFPAIGPPVTTTQITSGSGSLTATIPALQSNTVYGVTIAAPLTLERQTLCVKTITGNLGSFTTH